MKRILEVINLASSAENFIGSQFSYLAENGGYEMHLICSAGDNLPLMAQKYGVKYKVIPINRTITPLRDILSFIAICKYIRHNGIDIIISHQEKGNLLGQVAGFVMRVPERIILSHGIQYESMHGLKRWMIRTQDAFVSSLATGVICVSHFVRRTRIKDGIDRPDKSVVLGCGSCNGVDVKDKFNPDLYRDDVKFAVKEKFGMAESDFILGFCGRIVRDKGIEELVAAHKILVSKYPEKKIKLLVIGYPEDRDAITKDSLKYLHESGDVILTGAVGYSEVQKYYLPMDVLVLPSHRDGLGLAPLEAQAMEVPAIVTGFTGCAETIRDGVTGEYTDLNPACMAEVISHFFDRERSVRFGKAGRNFVCEHFSQETVNRNMLEYIDSIRIGRHHH